MELWIRSQDKEALRRINTSLYLKFGLSNYAEGDVWFIVTGGDNLGEYKTKERSLEVLDEIQSKLKPLLYLKPKALLKPQDLEYAKKFYEELNEREFITCDRHFEIIPFSSNVVVYEMPKE